LIAAFSSDFEMEVWSPRRKHEMAEAMLTAAEPTQRIQREMAEAMRAVTEPLQRIQHETTEVMRAAAEPALRIQREMAEAMRAVNEPLQQVQREMAAVMRAAAERACRIQQIHRKAVEAKRLAGEQTYREWDQILQDAVQEAVREIWVIFALERLRRCRARVAQIRQLLRLTKNRILVLLRQLCCSNHRANLVLIQESWFLTHGEHPPKLLTAAIPVCS
jgi:hypothetical protein